MNDRPVAIVTGASSGIGRETALALARRRYVVFLAARREQRLRDVADACRAAADRAPGAAGASAGANVARVAVTDVTDQDQVDALVQRAVDEFGRLDVMVNNAGSGLFGRVHEIDARQMRALLNVNFFGVFYGCKAAAPVMMRQRSGHIFNVSSIIGKRGTPFHGAYCAAKAAVVGLTESMRVEMMPYHVHVTCVMPTLTDTEFFDVAAGPRRPDTSFQKSMGMMAPAVVGRKIAATAGHRKSEIVFSLGGQTLIWMATLWPALTDRVMKAYHDQLSRRL